VGAAKSTKIVAGRGSNTQSFTTLGGLPPAHLHDQA
jgi:hypothetical protein